MNIMKEKQMEFTIIMAVYNVEPFLKEAVLSVVSQDIGFVENVQLIMVDDGSTDGSGNICDTFAEFFPENIQVIHQENAGVSAARNVALPLIKGKYVNFLDADDKLSVNTLSKVRDFFNKKGDKVDLVSIPMEFFGERDGGHPLNAKFRQGSRVIDLNKEPDAVQMSMSVSFVKAEAFEKRCFDKELRYAEDAKICVDILLDKVAFGVVSEGKYLYRKRNEGESSALQKSGLVKEWYVPCLKRFSHASFEASRSRYGEVLSFVQHTIMYDLQWRMVSVEKMKKVLSEEEINEYCSLFYSLLQDIDDEVIFSQKNIWQEQKTFLWRKKHGIQPEIRLNDAGDDFDLYLADEKPYFGLSHAKTVYDFLTIDKEKDSLTLEGYTTFLGLPEDEEVKIYLRLNGVEDIPCEVVGDRNVSTEVLGETILSAYPFRCTIKDISDYEKRGIDISLLTELRGVKLLRRFNVRVGAFFLFGRDFKAAYAEKDGWLIRFGEEEHLVLTKVLPKAVEVREELLLAEMEKKGDPGKIAVRRRRLARLLKPFFHKEIWLVSDRINKADDNGEALFTYLQQHKEIDAYFILSKDSVDFDRIGEIGKVVNYLSEEHLLLHLMADRVISSSGDGYVMNPFGGERKFYRDMLSRKQQVFLQHGITKDDISSWINRYDKNLFMIVSAAKPEYQSFLNGAYFYDESVVKLTGFPRYDKLENDCKKQVVIMPTWRQSLNKYSSGGNARYALDGLKHYNDGLKESDYFRYYNELINHSRLIKAAEECGFQLVFMPHPNMQPYEGWFDHHPAVKFCGIDTKYSKVISESSLALTDYSSVVFDFAYLRKPVLYTQFDKEEFFKDHLYGQGYFDYERDGFGEVEYDLEHTVDRIIEYMKNDCQLKDKYKARIEKFFGFNDRENCKRTFEAILSLGMPASFNRKETAYDSLKDASLALLQSAAEVKDNVALRAFSTLSDVTPPPRKNHLRYIFPSHLFKEGEKIAIYGAGEVGSEFYRQAKLYGFVEPVLIVDRNAESMQSTANIPVQNVEALLEDENEYDSVLIAIRFERVAGQVKRDLVNMGIPKEKIKWDGEVYFADDWGSKFWKRKELETKA